MISPTGNGLTIIISAKYTIQDEWLSFASWYSIRRTYPDADVRIHLPKPDSPDMYRWVRKAGIKRHRHLLCTKNITQPFAVIKANVMLVRPFRELPGNVCNDYVSFHNDNGEEFDICTPCDGDALSPFISVEVCGKYNKEKWTGKEPFFIAKSLRRQSMSVNEKVVLSLWEKMQKSYILMH